MALVDGPARAAAPSARAGAGASSCTATVPLTVAICANADLQLDRGVAVLKSAPPTKPSDVQRLRRLSQWCRAVATSMDGGRTWPGENEVEVWNEAVPARNAASLTLSVRVARNPSTRRSRVDRDVPAHPGPIRYGAYEMIAFGLRQQQRADMGESPTILSHRPVATAPPTTPRSSGCPTGRCCSMRTFGGRGVDLYGFTDSGPVVAIPHAHL
jgi:hypothetical protein